MDGFGTITSPLPASIVVEMCSTTGADVKELGVSVSYRISVYKTSPTFCLSEKSWKISVLKIHQTQNVDRQKERRKNKKKGPKSDITVSFNRVIARRVISLMWCMHKSRWDSVCTKGLWGSLRGTKSTLEYKRLRPTHVRMINEFTPHSCVRQRINREENVVEWLSMTCTFPVSPIFLKLPWNPCCYGVAVSTLLRPTTSW